MDKVEDGIAFGEEPWRKDRMHDVRLAILPEIIHAKTWEEIDLACRALSTARQMAGRLELMNQSEEQECIAQQWATRKSSDREGCGPN